MRIWIFNHYATKPDESATRHYDFGKELIKKGHKITIFASAFSHYKSKIKYLEPNEKWREEEIVEGLRFIWIRTFPYNKNNWRRFMNMISYSWRAFWIARKLKEKPDVIIGVCVHPFAAYIGYLLSKKKKSRFFFEVTDLWPQILVDMGIFSNRSPVTLSLRVLEKFLYKRAEKIITLWPYAHRYITNLGIPRKS